MRNIMHSITHLCSGRVRLVFKWKRCQEDDDVYSECCWQAAGKQETKVMIPYLREAINDYCASCIYLFTR